VAKRNIIVRDKGQRMVSKYGEIVLEKNEKKDIKL